MVTSVDWPMPQRVLLRHPGDASRATVRALRLARSSGLSAARASQLATAVSELVGNVVKYAEAKGEVRFQSVADGDGQHWLEVVVADQGPGMANTPQALEEHYSSGGTLGLGLPGARRLVDDFELRSRAGEGTWIRIRMLLAPAAEERTPSIHAPQAGGSHG